MGDCKAGLIKWEIGGLVGSASEDLEGSLDKHIVSLISYFSSHSYLPSWSK